MARNIRLLMALVECAAPFAHVMGVEVVEPVGEDTHDGVEEVPGESSGTTENRVLLNVSW